MKFSNNSLKVLLAVGLASGVAAPAFAADTATKVNATWQEAKTKLFDAFDKQSVTVDFKTGSANVDESEVSDLKALMNSNLRDVKIESIIVAAWADKDYPASGSLTDADKKLGDARAANVKAALGRLGAKGVETFTMAEKPSWIAKSFNLGDAKFKGEGTAKDAEDQYVTEVGQKLRDKGGPGKAVVYVRRAGEMAAH